MYRRITFWKRNGFSYGYNEWGNLVRTKLHLHTRSDAFLNLTDFRTCGWRYNGNPNRYQLCNNFRRYNR